MTGAPTQFGLDGQTTHAAPRCPQCKYDLSGIDATICPECGAPCDHDAREIVPRRKRLVFTLRIATYLTAPILFIESIMIGLYAKSLVVLGSEADHVIGAFIIYFALPTLTAVALIGFAERAARDPSATPERLDEQWGNAGIGISVVTILGWVIPVGMLMSGGRFC